MRGTRNTLRLGGIRAPGKVAIVTEGFPGNREKADVQLEGQCPQLHSGMDQTHVRHQSLAGSSRSSLML